MHEMSTDRIDVCLVDTALAAADVTATAESLSVVAVDGVVAAREWAADVSTGCFVTGGDTATVAALTKTDSELPVLVFANPADGLTEQALAAGATDVVAAVGPDRLTRLTHRIESVAGRHERPDWLASAVEGSIDGIAILDTDGTYQYVNDAHATIYGFERPEEMVGLNWRDCYGADECERFETTVMPTVRETGQWRGDAVGRRSDGESFPQAISLARLDHGGIVCVVRDITDQTGRQQLQDETEATESVLDALPDLFYVLDEAGTFEHWNDRFCEVTGYTDAELDDMSALEVIPPEHREEIATAMTSIYREATAETRRAAVLTKQGERIPYEFNSTWVTDADGDITGLAGTGRDITDQQLRRQWLSVLSNIFRHNVRNQLSVVQANADYAASLTTDDDVHTALDRIMSASRNLVDVSDSTQLAESVLRTDRSERGEIDLVAAVETAIEDADLDGVTVRTSLPPSITVIATESVSVAVSNLLERARDAATNPTVKVRITPGANRVYVGISDRTGIPDHERRVLTAGRDTTLQHGTDMDLWLVNWVVTVSGGDLHIRGDGDDDEVVLSFPMT